MVSASSVATLLNTYLNQSALQINGKNATYTVTTWNMSQNAFTEKYLLNPSSRVDVLFTVKEALSRTKRYRQFLYRTEETTFEVGVWLAFINRADAAAYNTLRDAAVSEVKRIFNANPSYGVYIGLKNSDHTKGAVWILYTVISVNTITES